LNHRDKSDAEYHRLFTPNKAIGPKSTGKSARESQAR
jgi:hypothetical protein